MFYAHITERERYVISLLHICRILGTDLRSVNV